MILYNKSMLAMTTALLMVVSLGAHEQDATGGKQYSFDTIVKGADGNYEFKTTGAKIKSVAKKGGGALLVGFFANLLIENFVPRNLQNYTLPAAWILTNVAFGWNALKTLMHSPKDGEAWATLGTVFAGELAGRRGAHFLTFIVNGASSNRGPIHKNIKKDHK